MSVNRVIGLRKIFIHETNFNSTALPAWNTSPADDADGHHWIDLGDVYMESATLVDDDPEVVVHKSETSSRKITVSKPGDLKLTLQLMDPDYDLLARYFGGTVNVDAQGNRSYERPVKFQARPFAICILPTEGDALTCPVVGISSKYNITYNETGIMLLDMTITMNQPVKFDEAIDQYGPMYLPEITVTVNTPDASLGRAVINGQETLQGNGGTVTVTASHSQGITVDVEPAPGCQFVGFSNGTNVTPVTFTESANLTANFAMEPTTETQHNVTLYIAEGYQNIQYLDENEEWQTIVFADRTSEAVDEASLTIPHGAMLRIRTNPTTDENHFVMWDDGETANERHDIIAADRTFIAIYKENLARFTVNSNIADAGHIQFLALIPNPEASGSSSFDYTIPQGLSQVDYGYYMAHLSRFRLQANEGYRINSAILYLNGEVLYTVESQGYSDYIDFPHNSTLRLELTFEAV